MQLAYKDKISAVDRVVNGNEDDNPTELIAWLILQGKSLFMCTLNDPDSLAHSISSDKKFQADYEIVDKVFYKKLGIEAEFDLLWDEQQKYELTEEDEKTIQSEIEYHDEINFHWDEGNLSEVLPQLTRKFGWQDRPVVEINLFDFFKTGKFDYVKIGQTSEWILNNFPKPDCISDMGHNMAIWQYGTIEFHFADDKLYLIWDDHFDYFNSGRKIRLNKWILDNPSKLTLEYTIRQFNDHYLDFSLEHDQNRRCVTITLTKSNVHFHFEALRDDKYHKITENPNQYQMQAFGLQA